MIEKLDKVIQNQQLFSKNDKLLVAVSGGIDSMVLCHVLLKLDFSFIIAHCNFNLRDQDSVNDELLVRDWALKFNITFKVRSFSLAKQSNIQSEARKLRYSFLEELRKVENCRYILTAHHRDDQLETFFLNLSRGAGIKGLRGMKDKSGFIIRPFLNQAKSDILNYAKKYHIAYRTDTTNLDNKYLRNFFRNEVLPIIGSRINAFSEMTLRTIVQLKELDDFVEDFYEEWKLQNVTQSSGKIVIKVPDLKKFYLLSLYLTDLGFHPETIFKIKMNFKKSGKTFLNKNKQIAFIDRDLLIIQQIDCVSDFQEEEFLINSDSGTLKLKEGTLSWKKYFTDKRDFQLPESNNEVLLNSEGLKFPLILRKWQKGDKIMPIGMNGKSKKVQDVFTNSKLSRPDKKDCYIVFSSNQALWITGIIRSDLAKMDHATRSYYHMNWIPNKQYSN